ncbi:MAG: 7-carboxy-7-deazaguanine synthase QueE [Crocinitomicaceae bacterium]|nr:7-carboxy-7-deazaguanine synthase QueE [Crocinitomicaceae bacterium]
MHFREVETTVELPIMEHFYSVQGEGFHTGRPAYFIRLAGCNVGCVWCDVKESWDVENHPNVKLDELIATIKKSKATFCVITGGEPALYDLRGLIARLRELNIEIAIETSGTSPLVGDVDWYCFSPKKFKAPVEEAYQKANELKIIIFNKSDFQWAEEHAEKVNTGCKLFLQPEWSKEERFLPEIIKYVKENPQWRISLQTHKYMNIP